MKIVIGKTRNPFRDLTPTTKKIIAFCEKCRDGIVWGCVDLARQVKCNYSYMRNEDCHKILEPYRALCPDNGIHKYYYGNRKTIAALKKQLRKSND